MNMMKIIKSIAEQNPEGFTADLNGKLVAGVGYVVALAETQNSFGDLGLAKVCEIAKKRGTYIGGWLEKNSGLYYFDASVIIKDIDEAKEFARKEKQMAIFDLGAREVIDIE